MDPTSLTYGPNFANGCDDHEGLNNVLHKLDEQSLTYLIHDYKNSNLEAIYQK